jgi:acetyl-CoA C-acetyltransferase
VGRIGGTLKSVPPEELARVVIQGILDRSGIRPGEIDEVVFGHCRQSSDNPNIARISMLRTAIPFETSAYTVMRQCASGLTAVNNGLMSIRAGQCEVVLAGGTESMSTAPFYMRGARFGLGTGNTLLLDSLVEVQPQSQPQEIFGSFNMGMTAENVAERYNVSRADQDEFALQSQKRALAAIAAGRFKDEIVPVASPQRKGDPVVFDTDEYPRDTTIEALGKLKTVFKEGGSVTAGNASGRNDGASAVLLMTAEKAAALGLKPIARFVGVANAGVDPRVMGIAPIDATRKALEKAGLRIEDIGLVELNEAFAAQSLACIRELGLSQDIVNVNGGAIALGHPVGSSGCRILVTLVHEMKKRGVRYGLATLCIAGGLGMADIVELL